MCSSSPDDLVATVIVPTTGNRVEVLKHSIPSILAQSESRIEVKVIGDGAAPETRALIEAYAASDPRIEFIDKPKHPSRGESYRHEVLQRARGRIVCYLCDRDLMLENHVAHMNVLLSDHDFAHSARVAILGDDSLRVLRAIDLSDWRDRRAMKDARIAGDGIPLACAAHTLAAYHQLVQGWSKTSPGLFTDGNMWWKFLKRPDFTAVSDNTTLTILYFPRYPKREWPAERRAKELVRWHDLMRKSDWKAQFERELAEAERQLQLRKAEDQPLSWRERAKRWYSLRRRRVVRIMIHYIKKILGMS